MKEFKVEVGMTREHMSEVLYATLKNDTRRETFALPRTTRNGVPIPTRFVKVISISAHGQNYNTSIWYVELAGFAEEQFVQNVMGGYERSREIIAMQHILKHLRQRRHLTTYYQISAQTGIRLEHPLVSELYDTLVIKGDWERAEQSLSALSSAGLFASFVNSYQPSARYQRLRGVDANGDAPSKRGGHAMLDVENQRIYLLGGFDGRKSLNDFWVYDIRSDRWRVISHDVSKENGPGPRACHKMAFDPKSGYIYLLGRLADEDMPKVTMQSSDEQIDDDVQRNANGIEEVPVNVDDAPQQVPERRRSVGVGTHSHSPLHKDFSSEFYRYKTRGIDEGEWKLLNIDTAMNGGPKLIYDHQFELDSEAQVIYVHGGRVIDGVWMTNKYSGMYSYDIRSGKWSTIPIAQLSHDAMPPRFGHSMVYDSLKRKLVMFAGQQESNRYLNDMWEYDLHRQTLIELTSNFTAAGGPEPCFAQRAVIDPELQEIYIFDGLTRSRTAGTPAAESAIWLFRYADRPGTWTRALPPPLPPLPHKTATKLHGQGSGLATKRTRSEVDAEDEASLETEIPVPRWAHQVVYDPKSRTFYMHGGNAGVSPATTAARSGRRMGNMELDDRLDDFWSMKLERPPVDEVIRRAKFEIRRQQFREMCDEVVPVKSLTFLQNEVANVVDHNNDAEEDSFRSLLTHLLQPSLPMVDPDHSRFQPSSSRSTIASPASTPSEHELGWTNELPADEDTVMADALVVDSTNLDFNGTMVGEAAAIMDDPHELRIREGRRLSSMRFNQRTDVFESLLSFISPEAKQPGGSLLDMLYRVPV